MRTSNLLALGAAMLSFSTSAVAEIRIDNARYASGVLVVRGKTSQPFQIIILDGRYKRRSDNSGHFVFRVPYRPRFCKIELISGSDSKSIEVKNCSTHTRRLPA